MTQVSICSYLEVLIESQDSLLTKIHGQVEDKGAYRVILSTLPSKESSKKVVRAGRRYKDKMLTSQEEGVQNEYNGSSCVFIPTNPSAFPLTPFDLLAVASALNAGQESTLLRK